MSERLLKRLESGKGTLELNGIRYLLIRPDTIVQFQKVVEREVGVDRCAQLMTEGGLVGGSRSSEKYMEAGRQGQELVDYMCEVGTGLGWGEFRLVDFNVALRKFAIEVGNSAFAEAYGDSEMPVCHLIRGVLEGLGRSVFGRKAVCIERLCLAKGDGVCRFEIDAEEEVASDEK